MKMKNRGLLLTLALAATGMLSNMAMPKFEPFKISSGSTFRRSQGSNFTPKSKLKKRKRRMVKKSRSINKKRRK